MSTRYRTVLFHPDPSLEWRIPVAALVDSSPVRVVCAASPPPPEAVGGSAAHRLLVHELSRLRDVRSFDSLQGVSGPHVSLGPAASLPWDPPDIERWIRKHVLPSWASGEAAVTV